MRHRPSLLRALRTAHDLATLIGDHGFSVDQVDVRPKRLSFWVERDKPDSPTGRHVVATLGLDVTAESHYSDRDPFTVTVFTYRGLEVSLFARYAGAQYHVQDADTGEALTGPLALGVAEQVASATATVGRRVRVVEVAA